MSEQDISQQTPAARHRRYVFVLMPRATQFDIIYEDVVKPTCQAYGLRCERVEDQVFSTSVTDHVRYQIEIADLIIADLTDRNADVFYETGLAHGLRASVILLARGSADIPADLKCYNAIIYGNNLNVLYRQLKTRIEWFIGHEERTTEPFTPVPERIIPRDQVFISYSHKDSKWFKRIQVHLKPLERASIMSRWDDTMITPGTEWRKALDEAVRRTRVAILLVSADFLASDFINTNELPPLLAAARLEGAVILPVILSACRFEKIKNLSQFQAVNPPSRPIVAMTRHQREQVFVAVSNAVEAALGVKSLR